MKKVYIKIRQDTGAVSSMTKAEFDQSCAEYLVSYIDGITAMEDDGFVLVEIPVPE